MEKTFLGWMRFTSAVVLTLVVANVCILLGLMKLVDMLGQLRETQQAIVWAIQTSTPASAVPVLTVPTRAAPWLGAPAVVTIPSGGEE